jgi:hypothetical protein
VTFPHARYRAPIEPEMLVLMVVLFLSAEPSRRSTQKGEMVTASEQRP